MFEVGCDVSRLQSSRKCDYVKMAESIRFAIVRVTYGAYSTDEEAVTHSRGFAAAGVPVGLYAFALMHHAPLAFAEQVASMAKRCGWRGELPIFVDVERPPAGQPAAREHDLLPATKRITWLQDALELIDDLTGATTGIYSGPNYWRTCMGSTVQFARRSLWAARYPRGEYPLSPSDDIPSPEPRQFGGWPTWDVWQYTGHGQVDGYAGNRIDLNVRRTKKTSISPDSDCAGRRIFPLQ